MRTLFQVTVHIYGWPGQHKSGLFGRFSPTVPIDPNSPECTRGPRSITVLHQGQANSDLSTKRIAHDGLEASLTDKSESHLTSKHGHELGVDDTLQPNLIKNQQNIHRLELSLIARTSQKFELKSRAF